MEAAEALHHRVEKLERSLRRNRVVSALAVAAAVVYACSSLPLAHAQSAGDAGEADVLRVRGLIIVDDRGRERIALGAPWPALEGRGYTSRGVGMVIVDSAGIDRLHVGAPVPDPPGMGRRIAPANGLTFLDPEGNERGGVGYLDNGRAVLVLDNDGGEGAAVYSFTDGQVGFGLMRQGTFRALMEYDPATDAAELTLSDADGRPRAVLGIDEGGAPRLRLLDENGAPVDRP